MRKERGEGERERGREKTEEGIWEKGEKKGRVEKGEEEGRVRRGVGKKERGGGKRRGGGWEGEEGKKGEVRRGKK